MWLSKTPLTQGLIIFLWTVSEMGWMIMFFDDTLGETFVITRELSTLGWLAEETEDDTRSDSKYVKWWDPSKCSSICIFSVKPAPISLPVLILYSLTLYFEITPNNVWWNKGWHALFSVFLSLFLKGLYIFKGRGPCLTILFLPIFLSWDWESRSHFINDNL